jgi:hypothetical protein
MGFAQVMPTRLVDRGRGRRCPIAPLPMFAKSVLQVPMRRLIQFDAGFRHPDQCIGGQLTVVERVLSTKRPPLPHLQEDKHRRDTGGRDECNNRAIH